MRKNFFSVSKAWTYKLCNSEISWAAIRNFTWELLGCDTKSIIYSKVSILSSLLIYNLGSTWSLLVVTPVLMTFVILNVLSIGNICSREQLVETPQDKWGESLRGQVRTDSHPSGARAAGNVSLPSTDTVLVVLISLSVVGHGALFQVFRETRWWRAEA